MKNQVDQTLNTWQIEDQVSQQWSNTWQEEV